MVIKQPTPRKKLPRTHYCKNGKRKKDYGTVEDANKYIKKHGLVNYNAYICPVCGAVHIGSSITNNGEH